MMFHIQISRENKCYKNIDDNIFNEKKFIQKYFILKGFYKRNLEKKIKINNIYLKKN